MEITDLHSGMKSVGLCPSGAFANRSTGATPTRSAPHSSSVSSTLRVNASMMIPPPNGSTGGRIRAGFGNVGLRSGISQAARKKPAVRPSFDERGARTPGEGRLADREGRLTDHK